MFYFLVFFNCVIIMCMHEVIGSEELRNKKDIALCLSGLICDFSKRD